MELNSSKKGTLVIISGFSGAGKGTVVNELIKKDNFSLSISATTRAPREGDVDGVSYFFKTKEEFEKMIEEDALIEYASYVGNYYGTPKAYVLEQLDKGNNVILEIEMQGAMKIKEKFPDAITVFITPQSFNELERRLRKRGTETEDKIKDRLNRAKEECSFMGKYDYIVINEKLEKCVEDVYNIIYAQSFRKDKSLELIECITNDFNSVK
ncbi:MAG: guanylate kinase [Lachnospiraceae bacterium]|nr:guanylate kinase [Lachnospiraceae bacterium]